MDKTDRKKVWIGFAIGIAPSALNVAFLASRVPDLGGGAAVLLFLVAIIVMPIAGLVCLFVPGQTKVGLGILLGTAAGWLVALAICGGFPRVMNSVWH